MPCLHPSRIIQERSHHCLELLLIALIVSTTVPYDHRPRPYSTMTQMERTHHAQDKRFSICYSLGRFRRTSVQDQHECRQVWSCGLVYGLHVNAYLIRGSSSGESCQTSERKLVQRGLYVQIVHEGEKSPFEWACGNDAYRSCIQGYFWDRYEISPRVRVDYSVRVLHLLYLCSPSAWFLQVTSKFSVHVQSSYRSAVILNGFGKGLPTSAGYDPVHN
ncbi:hypothetical protein F5I97DRAFT_366333 [Phlebopus sp. FC_14]|nr:hypothetical protein F5I97DRAFT_366333 [Phlebopus sp. FC_14]